MFIQVYIPLETYKQYKYLHHQFVHALCLSRRNVYYHTQSGKYHYIVDFVHITKCFVCAIIVLNNVLGNMISKDVTTMIIKFLSNIWKG